MKRILTTQQMAVADRLTIASGVDGFDLMERAGAAVAREALKFPVSGPVAVFCGPGNNGGDGFVCARHMADAGRDVDLYLFGDRNALRGDAAQAAAAWPGDIHPLNDVLRRPPSLIVDALFGAGLTRPLEGIAAQLSQMDWPLVVSVDVPSGLEG
ncbi:MAG: NAD(P)H-hydrate epimerase, partial [Pseudomonadota bacterium]